MKKKKRVDGENIIYHYIQKNILESEGDSLEPFQKQLVEHLIIDLGVWVPLNVYRKIPVLLPYVVRDSSSRKNKVTGEDEWGSSDKSGYLRDDNSLIKNIFSACPIKSSHIEEYDSSYLGNGFVASHIWREVVGSEKLASTIPQTNSFVPNLVWLPKQVSKLTDREKSYAQKLLQSMSHQIYKGVNKDSYTKSIWKYLPNPKVGPEIDITNLNFFDVPDDWLAKRVRGLNSELLRILEVVEGIEISDKKIKCSRYIPTLRLNLAKKDKSAFVRWLNTSRERIS